MKAVFLNPFLILLGFLPFGVQAQYITVSGYVTHFFTGNAVENVNVFESYSGIGTITGRDGFFKLILKQGEMNVTFAQSGFKSVVQKFTCKSDTTLNVNIEPLKWMDIQDKDELHSKANLTEKEQSQRKKFFFF